MSNEMRISFYLRKNYVNKNGEVSVRVFLSLNSERIQFTTNITVPLDLWDTEKSMASGKTAKARKVNGQLRELTEELNFHYKDLKRYDDFVTAEQIRDAYLGITKKTVFS